MNTSQITLLCAAAFAVVLPSCSSSTAPINRVPVSGPLVSDNSLSNRIFQEVNSYRASKGKKAVARHAGLDSLAQKHCDYLMKTRGSYGLHGRNVSHVGFEGRVTLARHKYSIGSIGENVASSTTKSASHILNLWAASKNHEHTMRDDWACTGIATAITPEGSVIVTQIFGVDPSKSPNQGGNYFTGFR